MLVIIAILATAIGVPLASQLDQQKTKDTEKQLELVKEAIYGFAMANGRLPCPATAGSNGVEAPVGTGVCTTNSGFVPSATLGLAPVDTGGFTIDGWGLSDAPASGYNNRIRYAVANVSTTINTGNGGVAPYPCATTLTNVQTVANRMQSATMGCLADPVVTMLSVASASSTCSPTTLATKVPFVLLSIGKNASKPTGGVGLDEAQNLNAATSTFVSHTPTVAGCGGEFDDIVTWGSLNTLFARMVQAGKLP